jgi:hypothetical protein
MDWFMPSLWSDAEGDAEGQGMAPIEVGIDGAIQIGTVKEESVTIEEGVEVPLPPPFVNEAPPLKSSSLRRCKSNKWAVLAITLCIIGIVAVSAAVLSTDKPAQESGGTTVVSLLSLDDKYILMHVISY